MTGQRLDAQVWPDGPLGRVQFVSQPCRRVSAVGGMTMKALRAFNDKNKVVTAGELEMTRRLPVHWVSHFLRVQNNLRKHHTDAWKSKWSAPK